jgi:2-methylcitrate dehydratase PrpD
VFEDVWGGFLKTYAHEPTDPGALTRDLGASWRIMRCAIKPYASCRDAHAAVDAIGRILGRHVIAPDDIVAVHARLSPFLAGMVGGRDATSLPAAQMSLPYAIAARILFGTAGLSAYTAERRADERLRGLIERVAIDIDETVASSDRASVTVATRDGRRIDEPTATALGAPDNLLADRELVAKFEELAAYTLPASQVCELGAFALGFDGVSDVGALRSLLRSPDAKAASAPVGQRSAAM